VKLRHLSPAVFVMLIVAFTSPAVLRADTIYYKQPDVPSIQSASGTIVRETDDLLEIVTATGQTISIARDNVFEIIRETPSAAGGLEQDDVFEDFPAASAVARRSAFDDTPSRSAVNYHCGFKGGMNISNVRADPQELEEGGSLHGYAFGFWVGVPLSHQLMIQTEALFSMKGDSETAAGYTTSTHLGYFELPVLAKFGFLHDAPVRPSLFIGPSLAVNHSAHSKLEGEGSEVDIDVKDQVRTFDLGLVIGGGLDFERGGRAFGVDLRYSRGLRDVGDGVNGSAHNGVFTVMGSIGLH
jgi:Outer membrane protein beta-barrel domain